MGKIVPVTVLFLAAALAVYGIRACNVTAWTTEAGLSGGVAGDARVKMIAPLEEQGIVMALERSAARSVPYYTPPVPASPTESGM